MNNNTTDTRYDRHENANSMGHVRILHAVPDAPNVDIYADDDLVAGNLAYGEVTDYISLPEGSYTLSLYVAGERNTPVLVNTLTVYNSVTLTVAAVDTLDNISFLAIIDSAIPMEEGNAMVRLAHLSPNAPGVDVTLPDGTVLIRDIEFRQLTQYAPIPPMEYDFDVRIAGTDTVVLTVPDINLEEGTYYTIYAIGLVDDEPALEALLLTDRATNHR